MKICITSQGDNLQSMVDPRFGRCAYFIFYDTDTDKFDALANTNAAGSSGVGIQNAQLMSEKEVKVLLTGNIGPNAASVLQESGVDVVSGITGSVAEAVEQFKSGQLQQATAQPTVPSKSGMGAGAGMGAGRGMGMGRSMAAGQQQMPEANQFSDAQIELELQSLKQQIAEFNKQLDVLRKKVEKLEK